MLHSLLLLTLLAIDPPEPGPTAPTKLVDTKGWDAVRYNDALVNDLYSGFLRMNQNLVALGGTQDPAAFEAGVVQLQADAQAALTQVSLYPAFKGDTSLRDAVGGSFLWARQQTQTTLPELFTLLQKPEVRNADLARAEELMTTLLVGGKAQDERVQQIQKDFARKNGFLLVESDAPPFADAPEFTAPGVPPEGSVLSGQVHMSFVLRYHNALAERQSHMVEAVNAFFAATSGDLGQVGAARERALATVRADLAVFRAAGDWQGDASLRDALVRFGEDLSAVLDGPFVEYVALVEQVSLTKKEANKANELASEGNKGVERAFSRFNPVYDDFRARWRFAEYEAWLAAQGE